VATATSRTRPIPIWLAGVIPILLIGALIGIFLAFNPIGNLRAVPPVEALAFERTVLREGVIELHVRNDGPDPVTVSQVTVNDSYRDFRATETELGRLEASRITIPYPWDEGLPLHIGLVTPSGVVLEHDIEAAALTPEPDASSLATYALLGLYIGVVPVAIGLLWFSALRRAGRRWLVFFLAFTVGLLLFLLVDTVAEGLDLATETAASLDGVGILALGVLGAVAGLTALESLLDRARSGGRSARRVTSVGLTLAYLVAAGIGLHNLGEGLAVGAALAGGEVALGTFLVLGFAIHNTTEGLAIVAPLGSSEQRPAIWHFVWLGLLAGAPAIAGAWLGGLAFSPAWATLAFGIAAGAIAQVCWQITRSTLRGEGSDAGVVGAGLLVGFVFMYVTGLFTF
jgi:zinc transporter ZupT